MENSSNITDENYNIKESPHYEEQKEEIELLQNIIPDRLIIKSKEPNYILEITVKSSLENPEKEYRLKIYLNYFYPEKPPKLEFYEINDFLQEERKQVIISELNKIVEENEGMGVLYQLYECAVGFADKEEERRAKILDTYEKQKTSNKFNISQMKKYKQIDDYYITDAIVLKNNYLVLSSCEDEYNPRLRIYDEFYENELHVIELIERINKNSKQYQYIIKKLVLYNISTTKDDLYVVCSDKIIRNYKINYLSKTIRKTGLNITYEFNSKYSLSSTLDMVILNDYNNNFLFVSTKENIFWRHNEEFSLTENESIISSITRNHTFGDVYIFNKNMFIFIGYKKSIFFLYILDDSLKKFKWGKEIEIKCKANENYISKVNEKNVLFWNNNLKEIVVIFVPTEEIVTKLELPGISSICHINNSTYLCSKEGINEIEFQNIFMELTENNKKYKDIIFIKPINKGYVCFGTKSTFFICQ